MSYTISSRFKGEHIVYAGYTICTSREHIVYGAFCGSTEHIVYGAFCGSTEHVQNRHILGSYKYFINVLNLPT